MQRLTHLARATAQRVGLDLVRYPNSDPLWRIVQLIRHGDFSTVLDVGANDGGFAGGLRRHGYAGQILSFEPLTEPFCRLAARTRDDELWLVKQCAVGDEPCKVTMNVAANNGASSSILPMLDRHVEAAPHSAYIAKEEVSQYRLDDLVPEMLGPDASNLYLKVDVQGYERAVLAGADRLLRAGHIAGLQLELSFVPLYEGGMTWQEGFARASELGMSLVRLDPGFTDPKLGQTLQADAVFLREVVVE